MIKAFKLVPFNKNKEELTINGRLFYVDVEERPEYWKDVLIISSKDENALKEIHKNYAQLKNHPKFKDKFVMINHYKAEEDKIEYYILEELRGQVDNSVNKQSSEQEVDF